MPILCVLIGFVISGMICCFSAENTTVINMKQLIFRGIILMILISFAAFGFFCGIKGLCPYLG